MANKMSNINRTKDELCFVMIVKYNGSKYSGFQRQKSNQQMALSHANNEHQNISSLSSFCSSVDSPPPGKKQKRRCISKNTTVQEHIESALIRLTGMTVDDLKVRASSRTDAGVHANGQVVAFNINAGRLEECSRTSSIAAASTNDEKSQSNKNDTQQSQLDVFWSALNAAPNRTSEMWQARRAINTRLPADVAIRSLRLHPDADFIPREGVQKKRYIYRIRFHRVLKDESNNILPICQSGIYTLKGDCSQDGAFNDTDRVWFVPWPLDVALMQSTCDSLCGHHNFRSFVHKDDKDIRDHTMTLQRFDAIVHNDNKNKNNDDNSNDNNNNSESITLKTTNLDRIEYTPSATNVTFIVEAERFRRAMIRRLVGYVVDVCRGKQDAVAALGGSFTLQDISQTNDKSHEGCSPKVFQPTDEMHSTVFSAPACGLCLDRVYYHQGERGAHLSNVDE